MPDDPFQKPLSNNALVIRFGRNTLELDHLNEQVALCFEAQGYCGRSFYGDNDLSSDEIAGLAGKPNREMRMSTVGRLRAAGFELERRGRFPHLTLRFGSKPSDNDLRRLEETLDQPNGEHSSCSVGENEHMTLRVDFNLEDEHGRIPARLAPAARGRVAAGETVLAEDEEGNRCKAHVVAISESGSVAYLAAIPGTWERPHSSAAS